MDDCITSVNYDLASPFQENISGKWIWANVKVKPGQWVCFRKSFKLNSVPESLNVKIAVDSKYWLWVNGQMVVFEGQVKNGPTPQGIYFDSIDIGKYLNQGKNTIAVLAVYFGKNGYGFFDGGTPGLLFSVDLPQYEEIVSNESWKAIENPAYHDPVPQKDKSYRLAEPDINYYAEDTLEGWQDIAFDETKWSNSIAHPKPFKELWPRPIPQLDVKDVDIFKGQENGSNTWEASIDDPIKGITKYTITNKTNLQGTPFLKVDAPAGKRISMYSDTWNEMANNGDSIRHSYVTKKGIQSFEALGWINGYQIYFEIPNDVKVIELGYRPSVYKIENPGTFKSDDEFINKLFKKCYDTLLVTMRDTFMDCPDRERAQWIGDAVNEMQMAFYGMDKNAGLLFKKAINQALHFKHKSGVLPSTVPNGLEHGEILDENGTLTLEAKEKKLTECFELPMQSLAFVHSFWQYYQYSGDKQPLIDGYESLVNYLSLWKVDSLNHKIEHRTGTWDWDDWGYHSDTEIIDQCWYYAACKNTLKILKVLDIDEKPEYAFIKNRIELIEQNFESNYWDLQKHGYYKETDNGLLDDRANALAVYTGLFDGSHRDDLIEVFKNRFESSPYMEKYVLEALYILNANNEAMERTKKRYKEMVLDYFPTLWEFWTASQGTRNHAWTGSPLTMAYKYNLGITPLKPGYEELEIRPHLASLKSLAGSINTPKGRLSVSIENDLKKKIIVKVPSGIKKVRINIPRELNNGKVIVNSNPVYDESVVCSDLPSSIKFVKRDSDYITYDVYGERIIEVSR